MFNSANGIAFRPSNTAPSNTAPVTKLTRYPFVCFPSQAVVQSVVLIDVSGLWQLLLIALASCKNVLLWAKTFLACLVSSVVILFCVIRSAQTIGRVVASGILSVGLPYFWYETVYLQECCTKSPSLIGGECRYLGLAKRICLSPKTYKTSHTLCVLGLAALHVHNTLHLFLLRNGLHIDSQRKIKVSFMFIFFFLRPLGDEKGWLAEEEKKKREANADGRIFFEPKKMCKWAHVRSCTYFNTDG